MKLGISAVFLLAVTLTAPVSGEDKPDGSDTPQLNEAEQAFVELMSKCELVGSFTVDGQDDAPLKPERYAINGATKVEGSNWVVAARIKYGKNDLTVPVPVEVKWAGDTPMIQVTNLAIPGLGNGFSSRVLFYEGRYAGTWQHGKVGGTMFGKIEKQGADNNAGGESGQPSDK